MIKDLIPAKIGVPLIIHNHGFSLHFTWDSFSFIVMKSKNISLFFNNSNVFRLYKTDLALSGIVWIRSEIWLVAISLGSQDVFEIAADERQTEYFSTHPEMFIAHHKIYSGQIFSNSFSLKVGVLSIPTNATTDIYVIQVKFCSCRTVIRKCLTKM